MTLTEFLDEHRIPYRQAGEHHHVGDGWVGMDCPECSPGSGRFRLGIRLDGRGANCWTCGSGPVWLVLNKLTGRPGAAAVFLEQLTHSWRLWHDVQHNGRSRTYRLPTGTGVMQPPHRNYLRSRGLDPDRAAQLWNVGGIGLAARLPWRLFLPVCAYGIPYSWTTRAIGDQEHRYISAGPHEESVSIKHLLYGADLARHAIVVVEGPLDAIKVGPGAVATFGTAVTPSQVRKISRFPVRAVCFDNEPAAQRAAKRLCAQLAPLPGVTHRVELDADDPGSASEKEIRTLRKAFLD